MGASQRTSLSLLIGLGAAGCMPHSGGTPSANRAQQVITKPAADQPDVPLVGDGDSAQKALVESVNDNVTRVSRIIRQREDARQLASDIREQREAIALKDKTEAEPDSKPNVRTPPEQKAVAANLNVNPKQQSAEPLGKPLAPPVEDAWANKGLSAAETPENGDFGDAIPARRVQGSVSAAPTEVQRVGPGEKSAATDKSPGIRSPGIDPLLAMQEQFLSRVNDQPKNLANQLELQLARLLRNESVPAMADLSALAGEDRELIAAVGDALANFRNIVRNDPSPLASEKARPFIEMADRIRARSDLSVQSVNLCSSVKAYGNYEPIEPMQFVAGNPSMSVFYCEVDGFLSQINEKQLWESRLSLELRLYNEAGMQLWRVAPETVIDISRKRRRDFFIAKRIQLPSRLAPGAYMLKATIRDLQANRVAESTLQVSIVGK